MSPLRSVTGEPLRTGTLLAIDPGNIQSAWVVIDRATCRPLGLGLELNEVVANRCRQRNFSQEWSPNGCAIEWIQSYGMAVGAEVFDTARWVGRFQEAIYWTDTQLVTRLKVKTHHCHSARATDANIRQALIDRFAPGQRNGGKGTKAAPGWFYGFRADIWAAYALAVYAADEGVC